MTASDPTSDPSGPRLVSLREAAKIIDPHHPERWRRWLGELVREGELPALRRGRAIVISMEDVQMWWRRTATRITPEARTWARAASERRRRKR